MVLRFALFVFRCNYILSAKIRYTNLNFNYSYCSNPIKFYSVFFTTNTSSNLVKSTSGFIITF